MSERRCWLYCFPIFTRRSRGQSPLTSWRSLVEELLPDPEDDDGAEDAEDEVLEVAGAKELDVEQGADEGAYVAAGDADDEVEAAALALAAHDAVGDVADEHAREDGPCGELCNVL